MATTLIQIGLGSVVGALVFLAGFSIGSYFGAQKAGPLVFEIPNLNQLIQELRQATTALKKAAADVQNSSSDDI